MIHDQFNYDIGASLSSDDVLRNKNLTLASPVISSYFLPGKCYIDPDR